MSNARERVSGGLGRPRPGHLASLLVLTRLSPPQKHVCIPEVRKARERRWDERPQHSYHFLFFLIIAITTGIPSGSLCRGERRGAPDRETRNDWICGRSGLALFAGSHRSPLEENTSLEPTLCQGVAVPSTFFVFSPGGRVRPSTLSYLLSTPLF